MSIFLSFSLTFPLDIHSTVDRKESLRIFPRIKQIYKISCRKKKKKSSRRPQILRIALRYSLKHSMRKLFLVATQKPLLGNGTD